MGVFKRMRDIVGANVNAMLDRAEDPEKLVRLMVREMEDALIEVKASIANLMAAKRKIARDRSEATRLTAEWESKAELAVSRGRDDLAREALFTKRRYADRVESLDKETSHIEGMIAQAKSDLTEIESKLKTVRERQRVLVQRHKQAQRRKRTETTIRKVDTSGVLERIERFENRIEHMESEAELVNFGRGQSVDDQLAKMQRDETIEKELAELKQKVQRPVTVVA